MKDIFRKEEKMLNKYPKEWLDNYYTNKKNVIIKNVDSILDTDIIVGEYISENNTILLVDEQAVYHELSHMAFNNQKKYNNKIFSDINNMYYENGVVITTYNNDEKYLLYQSLNEGFAEYLSRKNSNLKGQEINYYFVNLLIAIFGEDLLKYPLTTDPIGFLNDNRFYNINEFLNNLDKLNKYSKVIQVSYEIEKNHNEDIKKVRNDYLKLYNAHIIETFNSILNEYKKYSDRLINKEQLLYLVNSFYNYDLYGSFNNKKYNIKKYLKSIK